MNKSLNDNDRNKQGNKKHLKIKKRKIKKQKTNTEQNRKTHKKFKKYDNTSTLKKSSKYRNDFSKVSTYQYPFVDSRTLLDYNETMKNNHTNLKQGNKISSLRNSQKSQSFASDISSILLESYPFSKSFEEIDKNVHCNYLDIDSFNSSFSETKGLSFFHLNICSLPKHHDNLSILLESIHHKFDIIGISETRLNDSKLPSHNINISGYHCISTPT